MSGICNHCGDVVETLQSCEVCGAQVCPECKLEYGCKNCQGAIKKAD
ncbi:MAG: hypothetical protein MUP58_03790 [Candidatus Nanohaloarchaeota archaeon QJJ-9]|nr:hypothetical protein [Candidatus Nanohaloarchaeota archaeon QJJ-9]